MMIKSIRKISKVELITISKNELHTHYWSKQLKEVLWYPPRTQNKRILHKRVIDDLLHSIFNSSIKQEVASYFINTITNNSFEYLISNFHKLVQVIGFDNIKFLMWETNNKWYNIRSVTYEETFRILSSFNIHWYKYFIKAIKEVEVWSFETIDFVTNSLWINKKAYPKVSQYLVQNKAVIDSELKFNWIDLEQIFLNQIRSKYWNKIQANTMNSSSLLRVMSSYILWIVITKNDPSSIDSINELLQ
jgi:hypothetical protein